MKRRTLLLSACFCCRRVFAAVYSASQVMGDGSLYTTGYRNGHPFSSVIKVNPDASVSRFELNLTCRQAGTIEGLLRAAGVELGIRNNFLSLPGQGLITLVDDVGGSFHILVNGQLFLNNSAAAFTVSAGQRITVRLAAPGTLVAKQPVG